MVYNHKTRINPTVISFKGNHNTSYQLPKLVLSLADVHRLYGSLPWKVLVMPAADLARFGRHKLRFFYYYNYDLFLGMDLLFLNH